jgi:pimeloyl-ACP methyl ester carboxylesterase
MKALGKVVIVLLLVAVGSVLALRAGLGETDRAAAIERWAGPPSKFVKVDGVPIHVVEEGQGPVVVLLHGSIVDLAEWDDVAARLKGSYRVVRFSWPPYGLSGPDPKGEYTTPRAADLMDGLMKALGHDKFAVVATSNGSNVALEFNRRYPGHATAMAFSMLPLERPSQTRKVDWRLKAMLAFHKNFVPDWRHKEFWRLVLEDTTPPGFIPRPEIAERMRDMNNLPGALDRQAQHIAANAKLFKTSDVGAVAESVRVPVLLQWCSYDTVISQGAQASVKRFTNTKVELIEYPQLGHFPMWENPDLFTRDLKAFLDRQQAFLDQQESGPGLAG